MPLNYDFDMFSAQPKELSDDPEINALMKKIGAEKPADDDRIALFRDPVTVAALNAAPEPLKKYLIDSGFGLSHYDSGAAPGCYWASEEDARLSVMEKLAENMNLYDLPRVHDLPEDGFSLADLTSQMIDAEPVDDSARAEAVRPAAPEPAFEPTSDPVEPPPWQATPAAGPIAAAAPAHVATKSPTEAPDLAPAQHTADADRLPPLAAADDDDDARTGSPRRILGQIVSGAMLMAGVGLLVYAVLGFLL